MLGTPFFRQFGIQFEYQNQTIWLYEKLTNQPLFTESQEIDFLAEGLAVVRETE